LTAKITLTGELNGNATHQPRNQNKKQSGSGIHFISHLLASGKRLAGPADLLRSFEDHVVLDRFHALYTFGNLDSLVDIGARPDKASQLNHALGSFDVDFG